VIDAHTAAARDLVTAAGPDGALGRAVTGKGFKPGSYGEQVSFEAAKHEALIRHYDQALQNKGLSAKDRQALTAQRADAQHDLAFYRSELSDVEANSAVGQARAERGGDVDVKQKNTHWLDPNEAIPRSTRANASWDSLQTAAKSAFPDARPVAIGRDGLALPNGTKVTNTGSHGINLRQFVKPQSEGGYGGRVFYDENSGSMILAVNMRSNSNPNLVDRVEVPYRPTKDGWRPDFSKYSPLFNQDRPQAGGGRASALWRGEQEARRRLGQRSLHQGASWPEPTVGGVGRARQAGIARTLYLASHQQ
jgi:hypothetical protein